MFTVEIKEKINVMFKRYFEIHVSLIVSSFSILVVEFFIRDFLSMLDEIKEFAL
jgi:hypothetical protein